MGRLPSSQLHELIASLTKSEKRYFKLRSQIQGEKSDYVVLFDEIAKMSSYDEALLVERLEKVGKHKNLAFKKKHLYDLVLFALQDFHRDQKVEMQLLSLLNNVLITYNKGLYTHTEQLIEKGLTKSRASYKFAYELMFTQWKRDLVNHLQNTRLKTDMSAGNAIRIVDDLERVEDALLDVLHVDSEASKIYTKSTLIIRFGTFEEMDAIIREIADFRRRVDWSTLPFSMQMKINRSESIILFAKRDLDAQLEVLKESLALWEAHPKMIEEFAQEYVLNLNNLLVGKIESREFEGCEVYLDKLEQFMDVENRARSPIERMRAYAFYQYNILKLHNTKGEYRLAVSAFDSKRFEQSGFDLNSYKRTQILLERCVSFLFTGEFRKLIRIGSDVMSNYEYYQKEVLSQIRIMFYISHYLRENNEILEQRLKSKDALVREWFNEFPQEKRFLQLLLDFAQKKERKKELINFVDQYPAKVNPHFVYYLRLWAENA